LLFRLRSVYLSSRFNRSREEKNRLRVSTGWMLIDAARIQLEPPTSGSSSDLSLPLPLVQMLQFRDSSEEIPADKPSRCIRAFC